VRLIGKPKKQVAAYGCQMRQIDAPRTEHLKDSNQSATHGGSRRTIKQ